MAPFPGHAQDGGQQVEILVDRRALHVLEPSEGNPLNVSHIDAVAGQIAQARFLPGFKAPGAPWAAAREDTGPRLVDIQKLGKRDLLDAGEAVCPELGFDLPGTILR